MKSYILLYLLLAISFSNCTTSEISFDEAIQFKELDHNYSVESLDVSIDNNLAKLGRVLFYDKLLSKNGTVSCASCHIQENSFADETASSTGFLLGQTNLNTPTLVNLNFNSRFFYKLTTNRIDVAATLPIVNPDEMGLDWESALLRINGAAFYDELILDAFGTEKIDEVGMGNAMGEFLRSIVATDSKFDKELRGEYEFSDVENRGLLLFFQHCNDCHKVDPSSTDGFYSGSSQEFRLADIGLEIIDDFYAFKSVRIPSLRNLAHSAPYMHDGRFISIGEVIEHYNSGITNENRRNFESVDAILLDSNGEPRKLELTEEEKLQLEAFLMTLNDESINTDVKFSDPFEN